MFLLSALSGDNYWIIDTDYDNYALTYACRTLKEDGSCDDGYALVFSRNPRGLAPAIQRIVRQKQEEICMAGQFQPVLQSGRYLNLLDRQPPQSGHYEQLYHAYTRKKLLNGCPLSGPLCMKGLNNMFYLI